MESTLQPKLRFSEFDGDWKNYSFNDIFSFTTGKNIKQKEASPSFNIPCVRYGELYYMYKEVITKVINYTNLDESELKFSEGDEILLPSAGEDPMDIGSASALTLKDVAIGRTINILKPKNKNVYSSIFASYYINEKLKIKISSLAKGVSISNVYNTDLQTLFIKLPSLPEQQKIADYLSTIDEKLTLLEEKKTELSRYKKVMMQKLFSQEIRFKDKNGSDFADWKNSFGGDIFISHTNKNHNSDLDVLAITQEHGAIPRNLIDYKVQVSNEGVNNYKVVEKDDFIISLRSFQGGIEHSNYIGICSPAYIILRNIKPIEPLFYKAFFKSRNYINYLNRTLEGIRDGKMISYSNFAKSKLPYPSLPEQQKIADFLSTVDESIDKVSEQIKETQSFKKAMLQQMFV